ncbi:MAG: ABC transporter substrate-binding protein [Deltaproteobacteria bacterium]|nr:ABC transporter substrate-binding protein [Deltaproteobacteria bacterium]
MKRALGLTLLLGVFMAAVPARAEVGLTEKKILIGTSNSLTGPIAFGGTQQLVGVEAYLKHVNAQGGVNGRLIEWKWYDDAYKPQDAVANIKRLVEQDGVFAIINTMGTATSKAVVPYLEEKKVPDLFPAQGDPGLSGKKYVFTSEPFWDLQTRIICRWLVEKKGLKRIGIVYQDDAYGIPFYELLKEELKALNLELAAGESIRRGASDATVQVAKMSAANLDACLLALTPGQGSQVLKEAAKAGWKHTKFIGTSPLTDETFLSLAGAEGEGVWGFTPWPEPRYSKLPAMQKYREILAKYEPKAVPNRFNIYGYFYAMLAVEGMKRAGRDLTREGLIKAMESIKDWESGIVPPISFSPADHHALSTGMMVEGRSGRFMPISGWLAMKGGKLAESRLDE